jgi:phosphoglycerate kinase
MKTISTQFFQDKRALIRVDFNVPLNQGKVTDNSRIKAALQTIKYVLDYGGSVVLMSHLGRPKDGPEEKLSLVHIKKELDRLLGKNVQFVADCISEEGIQTTANMQPGDVVLLENLRFYPEEKAGNADFAKKLSEHGDIYINDAFGTAHRKHASTAIIADYFPTKKCFGLLLEKEIKNIDTVLHSPKKPTTAIIGGAKVSSKIIIIEKLLDIMDNIIIGGGMAYTFIKAKGGEVGNSLVENDYLETALNVMKSAKEKNVAIHLPTDTIIADEFSNDATTDECSIDNIPDGWMGLDIGAASMSSFISVIKESKTILWNGPMGVFEMEKFKNGTISIAKSLAKATENGAYTLVGGGDSVAAINQFDLNDQVSYVSTGGGAMLEYLEGKELPGIQAINKG